MSVVRKGMQKPKKCVDDNCTECMFVGDVDECVLQNECYLTFEEQYANCQMVELPEKHGRLIDADRLKEVLEKNFGHTGGVAVLVQLIDVQPTILEAEGQND